MKDTNRVVGEIVRQGRQDPDAVTDEEVQLLKNYLKVKRYTDKTDVYLNWSADSTMARKAEDFKNEFAEAHEALVTGTQECKEKRGIIDQEVKPYTFLSDRQRQPEKFDDLQKWVSQTLSNTEFPKLVKGIDEMSPEDQEVLGTNLGLSRQE